MMEIVACFNVYVKFVIVVMVSSSLSWLVVLFFNFLLKNFVPLIITNIVDFD